MAGWLTKIDTVSPDWAACESQFQFAAPLAVADRAPRASLPFRAVNRRDRPGHDPGLQRHHLLPRQLLSRRCFGPLLDEIGRGRIGFDDFRSNGLLLPACEGAAARLGLPLHRGPHRDYNAMVIERVGEVEADWAMIRRRAPEIAHNEAAARLRLLQRGLRRRLLDPGATPLVLHRAPVATPDFTEIEAMVDLLWPGTQPTEHELALIAGGQAPMLVRAARSALAR